MLEVLNDDELIVSAETILEATPEGRHPAICVDVVPIGEEETEWKGVKKMQPKVVVVFQAFPETGEKTKEGLPFQAENKFTASLAPEAILRLKLEKWRGRAFTAEEMTGFNLMKLRGVPAWISIIHNGNFANIVDIEPYLDDAGTPIQPIPKAEGYVRRKYKKKEPKANGNGAATTTTSTPAAASPSPSNANKDNWVPF
jgi:hypothetical protein